MNSKLFSYCQTHRLSYSLRWRFKDFLACGNTGAGSCLTRARLGSPIRHGLVLTSASAPPPRAGWRPALPHGAGACSGAAAGAGDTLHDCFPPPPGLPCRDGSTPLHGPTLVQREEPLPPSSLNITCHVPWQQGLRRHYLCLLGGGRCPAAPPPRPEARGPRSGPAACRPREEAAAPRAGTRAGASPSPPPAAGQGEAGPAGELAASRLPGPSLFPRPAGSVKAPARQRPRPLPCRRRAGAGRGGGDAPAGGGALPALPCAGPSTRAAPWPQAGRS